MSTTAFKYWAFLSYAHADERWTAWLHKSLERYRIPGRLVGRTTPIGVVPKKLFPVFRDRDELAGSAALGPELQKALGSSSALIVVCSSRSARSRWVNEEIKYYKSLGRADRVFALIVDGEPNAGGDLECFPEALRHEVDAQGRIVEGSTVEPIAADARRQGDGRHAAKLKLISGVLGLGFDELRQREMHARNRRLAVLAGVAFAVAATTMVLAIQASMARDDAQRRQRQAEDLIQFMLGDLRKNLEPIGKLDILGAVGDKAMEYFGSLDEQDVTDAVLQSRARALRQIGEVRSKQGDLERASESFREALKLDSELVERHPADAESLFNVAESQYSVGYAHYVRGELEQAQDWFEKQRASLERLTVLDPGRSKWRAELAGAWINLGGIKQARGEADLARKNFDRALVLQKDIVEREPENVDYILALADLYGWLAHIEIEAGNHELALHQIGLQNDRLRYLTTLNPEHADYRYRLASGLLRGVYSRSALSRLAPDMHELVEALEVTRELTELDESNVTYARLHGVALSYREDAEVIHGRREAARKVSAESLELARDLYKRAPDSSEVLDDLLSVLIRASKLAWLAGDKEVARELIQEALITVANPERDRNAHRWLEVLLLSQWFAPDEVKRQQTAEDAKSWLAQIEQSQASPRPDLMVRYYALNGTAEQARSWVEKLTEVERRHPYIRQFCAEFNFPLGGGSAGAGG